jgi:hypothetical protein
MRKYSTSFTVHTEDDHEFEATFNFEGVYEPAHLSGLPEDCYPDGSEVNILTVEIGGNPAVDFEVWSTAEKLTEKEVESIQSCCMEAMIEAIHDSYNDDGE